MKLTNEADLKALEGLIYDVKKIIRMLNDGKVPGAYRELNRSLTFLYGTKKQIIKDNDENLEKDLRNIDSMIRDFEKIGMKLYDGKVIQAEVSLKGVLSTLQKVKKLREESGK